MSATGHSLTINALGDQLVPNYAYSGPSATTAPFNQKKITRHYGFGGQCTSPSAGSATCNTASQVTIGGVPATISGWSDTQITVTVPTTLPACAMQQQALYGGSLARCGELVITAGNGKQSVDAVTVTVGGKAPTILGAAKPLLQSQTGSIQNAIDAAAPGDLIIVPPGDYEEMVLMWKPVRLQGVGAASVVLNANTQPAGKLDPWRREVNCLFGLALDGAPISSTHAYDPTGTFKCGSGVNGANFTGTATTLNYFHPAVLAAGSVNPPIDRLPLEAAGGGDATLNGNLAELLQEPTLMGSLEGAGITVLSKGVNFPSNPFASDIFPTGTKLLTAAQCGGRFPSNFWCNPSRIDGITLTQSSQGGGAIFVHAWGHNLEIANNRIRANAGTLSGGINVGQGEHPGAYVAGNAANAAPGSCEPNLGPANTLQPYCFDMNVNVHHNAVSLNSSTGDELFSATPAGAGGVSFCTGSDYYKFNFNWVCGNLSSGDGGGFGHIGLAFNGDIEHNTFLFNQSLNPTIPTNGGGLIIMGAPDVDPPCGTLTDADCVPPLGSVGPSDGVGPGLVINANLILGNAAEAGTGGGIAFQSVNGTDVVTFPNQPKRWYAPKVTNNIIANNVAGWDGAGISLLDALKIDIINNTIVSNSTTATAGVLFNTLGAPLASQQGPTCTANCGQMSQPQPAGLVSERNSAVLTANLPASVNVICPEAHYAPGTKALNGTCRVASYPELYNNVIWQNSAYDIGVGALSPQFQQATISMYNAFTGAPAPSQPQADATTANGNGVIITGGTGACVTASFWDLGVRGDTGPSNHASGVTLAPMWSVLTDATDYPGLNNTANNPTFMSQYCNGSRQPPEYGSSGWSVPPGISDATVPNPVFSLTPVATVDEGNNWVNLRWGPLSLVNPVTQAPLGNYAPAAGSPAIDYVPASSPTYAEAPSLDFYGNPRKTDQHVDAGAVEFLDSGAVGISPVDTAFPVTYPFQRSAAVSFKITNQGATPVTGVGQGTLSGSNAADWTVATALSTCGRSVTTLAPGGSCLLEVQFTPKAVGSMTADLSVAYTSGGTPGAVVATLSGLAP